MPRIWYERAGVFPGGCWCALVSGPHGLHLHIRDTLTALLLDLLANPRDERCLVG